MLRHKYCLNTRFQLSEYEEIVGHAFQLLMNLEGKNKFESLLWCARSDQHRTNVSDKVYSPNFF